MNNADIRRYMARIRKDIEDPEGAPRRARSRARRRARRAEDKRRHQQEQLDEWLREIRRPRPMIERDPSAFPREQVEAYWREKREREEAEQTKLALRNILRKRGLSEDEVEAQVNEHIARSEPRLRHIFRDADGDKAK